MSSNKVKFDAGDVIIQQGDEGYCAYIVKSGHIEILIEKENGLVQRIGTRGPGSIIGEMALIDKKPRTATIKAIDECILMEITQADFDSRLENSDSVIQMVTKVILARYRDLITRAQILNTADINKTPEELEKGLIDKTNAVADIQLSNELQQAFDQNHLELHYQPIIDTNTEQTKGIEALIRWNHPEKGFISPDIFIPVAEENGLIVDISRWVTSQACLALQHIKSQCEIEDLFVSVNYSALDFADPSFRPYLKRTLKETGVAPHELYIEITERLLMNNPSNAREVLEECQKDGMLISIDDFGTGYSSLSYLYYFPINILKIDRSFIVNMITDNNAFELVKSIISLSHNLKMKVIAEGIEEKEQHDILQNMECDQIQGFCFAKPMPIDDLVAFIKNKNA